jgi:hypothetical protein
MADAVSSTVLVNGKRKYVIKLTNISDGTGESAVVKVTKSTLTNLVGAVPGKLSICGAKWNIQGFSSVRLYFDNTVPAEALIMTGMSSRTFDPPLSNPGTGATGNLTITTAGNVAGATYDITLEVLIGN